MRPMTVLVIQETVSKKSEKYEYRLMLNMHTQCILYALCVHAIGFVYG